MHGHDGLDEISLADETTVAEFRTGELREYVIAPEDYGLKRAPLDALRVRDAAESAAIIRGILDGAAGAPRDVAILNAGAALTVAGVAPDLEAGIAQAAQAIDSGKARQTLAALVRLSSC